MDLEVDLFGWHSGEVGKLGKDDLVGGFFILSCAPPGIVIEINKILSKQKV